jgi:hypothetical protein
LEGAREGEGEGVGRAGSVSVSATKAVLAVDMAVSRGCTVGIALCVSVSATKPVLAVEMAVSIRSVCLSVGVDWPLPQDASITAARNKGINNALPKMFILPFPLRFYKETLTPKEDLPKGGSCN